MAEFALSANAAGENADDWFAIDALAVHCSNTSRHKDLEIEAQSWPGGEPKKVVTLFIKPERERETTSHTKFTVLQWFVYRPHEANFILHAARHNSNVLRHLKLAVSSTFKLCPLLNSL